MNLTQIIEALPQQVYLRRGELVIHFSDSADLITRVQETAAAFGEMLSAAPEANRDCDRPNRARRPRGVTNGEAASQPLLRGGNSRLDEIDPADSAREI